VEYRTNGAGGGSGLWLACCMRQAPIWPADHFSSIFFTSVQYRIPFEERMLKPEVHLLFHLSPNVA